MSEARSDLLYVMSHENKSGTFRFCYIILHKGKVACASHRIEPGARLVQKQCLRFSHKSATEKKFLPFALRKLSPVSFPKMTATDLAKNARSRSLLLGIDVSPEIDHCPSSADDDVKSRLPVLDHSVDLASYVSDARLDLVPIVLTILATKGEKATRGWSHESIENIQQGALAGSIST